MATMVQAKTVRCDLSIYHCCGILRVSMPASMYQSFRNRWDVSACQAAGRHIESSLHQCHWPVGLLLLAMAARGMPCFCRLKALADDLHCTSSHGPQP